MQKTFLDVFEVKSPVLQETEAERKDEVLKKEETFEEKLERLFGKNSLERGTEEAEEGETEAAPERQRFKIENKEQLFWVMKKYRKIMKEKLENEAVAEKEIERIKNWLVKENEKLQQRLDFFAGLVEEYHRTLLEQDPKKKTLTTPYGSSKLRNLGPELIYDDERLIAWIEANTEEPEKYINIKKIPNKQRLKKHRSSRRPPSRIQRYGRNRRRDSCSSKAAEVFHRGRCRGAPKRRKGGIKNAQKRKIVDLLGQM